MTAHFAHEMPYGAAYRAGGHSRFRLWAPALQALSLRLGRHKRRIAMQPAGDGWFEVESPAQPGEPYSFELPDGKLVPDPASRRQAEDVHSASIVVDPAAYKWRHPRWRGRPWHEAVIYELHVGTFAAGGTFDAVRQRLPRLAELGITAVELMPVADFGGRWNWGYDGVLPYAPDARYGTPEDLKTLIDAAHELGIMVFLDVVYNHFGPDGNYLSLYAPEMFTDRRRTPWGAAIDFGRRPVRDFFIHNALYWIEEYRFDGLRLDAVHQIIDDTTPHVLEELAARVRATAGPDRHVHLILENENNSARLIDRDERLAPRHFTAQWNDDFHHCAHVLSTGETAGYYMDYAQETMAKLGRALAEGFVYQGELSPHGGRARGEPSARLPPVAFVNCLQNHDQVGNRAFGERLIELAEPAALRALSAILVLAPAIPMLFMGEEFGCRRPFNFFTDFQGDLADAVRNGRREEFARFPAFSDPEARERIPDPQAEETYRRSIVGEAPADDPLAQSWLNHYRTLMLVRRTQLVPRLARTRGSEAAYSEKGGRLTVNWRLGDGSRLSLLANLSGRVSEATLPAGRRLWPTSDGTLASLPPWFVGWFLDDAAAAG